MNPKKLLSLVAGLLVFQTVSTYPIEINPNLSGSWYNHDQSGHGLSIEVMSSETTVIYWYVYNPDGTPTFLIAIGENQEGGRVQAVAYHNTGMVWNEFNPATRTETEWGTITVDFSDCNSGSLSWQAHELGVQAIPYGFGSTPITRLVAIDRTKCAEHPYAGIYKGYLESETEGGSNPAVALLAINGSFVVHSDDLLAMRGEYVPMNTPPPTVFIADGAAYSQTGDIYNVIFQASGSIVPDYRFVMDYNVGSHDNGFGDFYPLNQLYWRGLTLEGLAGVYQVGDSEGTTTIAADGSFTGMTSQTCSWSGQITIPDTRFNLFDVQMTVSGCENDAGVYEAQGYTTDAEALEDGHAIRIFGFNDSRAIELMMVRDTGP